MTDNQLSVQIENQYEWAQDAVSQEWHMYEIAKRDGYFAATEAAKTTRLVAMTLERVDRLDKKQGQVILHLKVIVGCLIFITVLLAWSLS